MTLYKAHPLRQELNDEVHSRPPMPLRGPTRISYLVFVHADGSPDHEPLHLQQLASEFGLDAPDMRYGHCVLDAGAFRLKWERHTEFSSYTFMHDITPEAAEDTTAIQAVSAQWRLGLPGKLIVATHLTLLDASRHPPAARLETLADTSKFAVVSRIAKGAAWVFTDFQLHDGFSQFTVIDEHLNPRQAGRNIQRLLEIETYRTMALLALPVAQAVGRMLRETEVELADLIARMSDSAIPADERDILAHLTRLAAEVEQSVARTTYRFGAATAYYRLVRQRNAELREMRVEGFPNIADFVERRLAPATDTCVTMARRQEELSARISRNSQLLRTRVDIEMQQQNKALLEQMNRRAKLQLRLQETVEGLSIVAITYYGSQLINYLAKGAKGLIAPATPEVITAISIPIIAVAVALGLRRMRKALAIEEGH